MNNYNKIFSLVIVFIYYFLCSSLVLAMPPKPSGVDSGVTAAAAPLAAVAPSAAAAGSGGRAGAEPHAADKADKSDGDSAGGGGGETGETGDHKATPPVVVGDAASGARGAAAAPLAAAPPAAAVGSRQWLIDKANTCYQNEDWIAAVRNFEKMGLNSEEAGSGNAELFMKLGLAYQKLGHYLSAKRCYEKAEQGFPKGYTENRVILLNRMGDLYYDMGDHDEALVQYKAVVTLLQTAPDAGDYAVKLGLANAYNNIGGVYHKYHESNDMRKLRDELDYCRLSGATWLELSVKCFEEALGLYRSVSPATEGQTAELETFLIQTHNNMGEKYRLIGDVTGGDGARGNYDEAIVHHEKAISICGQYKKCASESALSRFYLALAQAKRDGRLNPANFRVALELAITHDNLEVLKQMDSSYKIGGEDENILASILGVRGDEILYLSALNNSEECLRYLLLNYKDFCQKHINRKHEGARETALHVACRNKFYGIVGLLMLANADISVKDVRDKTPFQYIYGFDPDLDHIAVYNVIPEKVEYAVKERLELQQVDKEVIERCVNSAKLEHLAPGKRKVVIFPVLNMKKPEFGTGSWGNYSFVLVEVLNGAVSNVFVIGYGYTTGIDVATLSISGELSGGGGIDIDERDINAAIANAKWYYEYNRFQSDRHEAVPFATRGGTRGGGLGISDIEGMINDAIRSQRETEARSFTKVFPVENLTSSAPARSYSFVFVDLLPKGKLRSVTVIDYMPKDGDREERCLISKEDASSIRDRYGYKFVYSVINDDCFKGDRPGSLSGALLAYYGGNAQNCLIRKIIRDVTETCSAFSIVDCLKGSTRYKTLWPEDCKHCTRCDKESFEVGDLYRNLCGDVGGSRAEIIKKYVRPLMAATVTNIIGPGNLSIYLFPHSRDVGRDISLYNSGTTGLATQDSDKHLPRSISVGVGKEDFREVCGTVAHEVGHDLMHQFFSNVCRPCYKDFIGSRVYGDIYEKIARVLFDDSSGHFWDVREYFNFKLKGQYLREPNDNTDEDRMLKTITTVFTLYDEGARQAELIVRVPQIIATFGADGLEWLKNNPDANLQGPLRELLNFYTHEILPKCASYCETYGASLY